jgi:formylglycine-generating enzyme required for sulfatase activity
VDAVLTQPLPPAPDGGTLSLDVATVGGGQLVGLSGGVSEWMRDAFHGLDRKCWATTTLVDPVCEDSPASTHAVRGGSWESIFDSIVLSTRRGGGLTDDYGPQETGFRCLRPVMP